MLSDFLQEFYKTISFKTNECFKEIAYRNFFIDNAALIEQSSEGYIQKTLDTHISEFNEAIVNYPQLFMSGFIERQLSFSFVENSDTFLVSSEYTKSYTRDNEIVVETGTNNMIIVKHQDTFKIVSILW